ncbi:MAG TPA: RNA 2',3'-cyclic phosphodiesterase [Anaerovoracaceae bacterium]|nr:RNA 2',3'-cyclic phosphodiesterase [Anaerovoracaceae bacterium]
MRVFIGIDFPKTLKEELQNCQHDFRNYSSKGRWRNIDNLHLTLKFISSITAGQKIELDAAMVEVCKKYRPFNLEIGHPGIFGDKASIRTLWMGIDGDLKSLYGLQREIELAAEKLGFDPEGRRYRPHITIGQDIVFDRDFTEVKTMLPDRDLQAVKVDCVYLFKSEQIQGKRVYTKISGYELS